MVRCEYKRSRCEPSVWVGMAEIVPLRQAVAELVLDGDMVALEGFTHLIPFAAGQEIIRQERRAGSHGPLPPRNVRPQSLRIGSAPRGRISRAGTPPARLSPPLRGPVGAPRPRH